jgi:hypothetical protein
MILMVDDATAMRAELVSMVELIDGAVVAVCRMA